MGMSLSCVCVCETETVRRERTHHHYNGLQNEVRDLRGAMGSGPGHEPGMSPRRSSPARCKKKKKIHACAFVCCLSHHQQLYSNLTNVCCLLMRCVTWCLAQLWFSTGGFNLRSLKVKICKSATKPRLICLRLKSSHLSLQTLSSSSSLQKETLCLTAQVGLICVSHIHFIRNLRCYLE